MALLLSETDVVELLPMERALQCVEESFIAQGRGRAINRSRERIMLPHTSLHYMAGALPDSTWLGMKIYTVSREGLQFVVLLFDADKGNLLALMEADQLGRIRTGAASGVATKYLARSDATRVGSIGTGRQARTQLEAVAKVRKLSAVRVFGRDEERRRNFCREMAERLGLAVEPASSAEEATRFGEIVITATTSKEPVVHGEWLQPGTHVNAIGANMANRCELDAAAIHRASLVTVDSLEQSQLESGDLIQGLAALNHGWDRIVELHAVVTGAHCGRTSDNEVTIFESNGIALWDVAVAGHIFRQAMEKGWGKKIDLG